MRKLITISEIRYDFCVKRGDCHMLRRCMREYLKNYLDILSNSSSGHEWAFMRVPTPQQADRRSLSRHKAPSVLESFDVW